MGALLKICVPRSIIVILFIVIVIAVITVITVIFRIFMALAQEVERVVNRKVCWFDPRLLLAECRGVP